MEKAKKLKVHLVMSEETRWRLRQLAARANVDMSQYVADYINGQFEKVFGGGYVAVREDESAEYVVHEGKGGYGQS